MSADINLLLTGAGTQTFANVFYALKKSKNSLRIIACDINSRAYGMYLADKAYIVHKAGSPDFISGILKICRQEKIDVLIPLLSMEYLKFSRSKNLFKKYGIVIPISDYQAVKVASDKKLTYEFFLRHNIPTPSTFLPAALPTELLFPLVVKPRLMSGSKFFRLVKTRLELDLALKKVPRPVVQKFLQGKEYTVDVLADFDSQPIAVVPRTRLVVKEGKSVQAKTISNPLLTEQVKIIIRKLKLAGPANIQCFKVGPKFYFTEINPRFSAGGLPLTVAAGINTPELLLKMAKGEKINPQTEYKDNLYMFRYLTEKIVQQDNIINRM